MRHHAGPLIKIRLQQRGQCDTKDKAKERGVEALGPRSANSICSYNSEDTTGRVATVGSLQATAPNSFKTSAAIDTRPHHITNQQLPGAKRAAGR